MSAGLSLLGATNPALPTTPELSSTPSTPGERASASWRETQTSDRYWNLQDARRDKAQKIIDDLHAMTGERLANPFLPNVTLAEKLANYGQSDEQILAGRLQKLREATAKARSSLPQLGGLPQDFLDVDQIDPQIAQESGRTRAEAERLVGTGNGLVGFGAAMAGETFSPHGIASMFLPATRLPMATAGRVAEGWLANVSREALVQGAMQAGVQAVASGYDYLGRRELGTEQTAAEYLAEVARAGAAGAVFGGTLRAAHLGILKAINRGIEVPPAVRDAAVLQQSAELNRGTNALNVPAGLHEQEIDRAVANVTLGRAASPGPEVQAHTPTIHDAVRLSHPDLMAEYDRAAAVQKELRAVLSPTDDTIERLRQNVATVENQIQGMGPQPQAVAEQWGQKARMAQQMLDEAVARKAALEAGNASDTVLMTSLRQQLAAVDTEMRDLLPRIQQAFREMGGKLPEPVAPPEVAKPLSPEAGISEPRLSPQEHAEIRQLQEDIGEYQRLQAEAPAEDKAAWQSAIDAANQRISEIMGFDPLDNPQVQRLLKDVSAPAERPAVLPEPPPVPKSDAARVAEAKAQDAETVRMATEVVEGKYQKPPIDMSSYKRALQAASDEEKEANIAVGCVMGSAL